MTPVIEVRGLTKRFGATEAVTDLSFSVEQGTVCGFLGPNGAGKSTTMRCMLGLVEPTAGSATILGMPYRDLPDGLCRVGSLLESSGFHPGRTGRNHLRSMTRLAGLPDARADVLLELVALTPKADVRVGKYSLGMRQRLSLAVALLGDPDVLLLDEPANGMDPEGMRWLRTFLRAEAAKGKTVVISSHVLSEVAQTVDEVVIIHRGRLVTHSPIGALHAAAGKERSAVRVRVRAGDVPALRSALTGAGIEVATVDGDRLVVRAPDTEVVGTLAADHAIPVLELALDGADASLEDVFFRLLADAEGRPISEDAPA